MWEIVPTSKSCFCWCYVKIQLNKCNIYNQFLVSKPPRTFFSQRVLWRARKGVSFSRRWLVFRAETSMAVSDSGPVHCLLHLLAPRCQLSWWSHPHIATLHACHFIFMTSRSLSPLQMKFSNISNSIQCSLHDFTLLALWKVNSTLTAPHRVKVPFCRGNF